jgi:hypothetical protein
MTVELKDFVAQTLREILDRITTAQAHDKFGNYIAPRAIGGTVYPADSGVVRKGPFTATVVKFDIGVTAETTGSTSADGGLKVAVLSVGVGAEKVKKSTAANRIQFGVPICLPSGNKDRPINPT